MKEFTIPESWGKYETQATQAFGLGKDDVLVLLHDIQRSFSWAKEDYYNLVFCAGWLEGVLHARRERERAQKYPATLRDLNSMLEYIGDNYQSDLKKEGRRMGIQVDFSSRDSSATAMPELDINGALEVILEEDIYPRSVPVAMFILFSGSINPRVIYHKYIDGFSLAYRDTIYENKRTNNTVSQFIRSKIPPYHESFVFINNYIFESENAGFIINAKLFMNPLREKSTLRLINEEDDSVIAEVDVKNRIYKDLYEMNGKEEDYLEAGSLLLESLASIEDKVLHRRIGEQASKQIVAMVAEELSIFLSGVYDKPFAEHVKRLEGFNPVATQYKNFIAPNGYDELIGEIRQYVSAINGLSDVFFSELDQLLHKLRKVAGS